MSEIRVNTIVAAEGTSAPNLPYGIQVPTGMGITGAGGVNITGIITATGFEDVNGNDIVGTALNIDDATGKEDTDLPEDTPLKFIFKAARTLHISAGTSVRVDSDATSGGIAFMREADTFVGSGSTLTIGAGTTLISDALTIFKPAGGTVGG